MKTSLEGLNSRFKLTEELAHLKIDGQRSCNLQNREKRMKKFEQSLIEMWNTSKCTNICTKRVAKGKERKKGAK